MKVRCIAARVTMLGIINLFSTGFADRCCQISGRALPKYNFYLHGRRSSGTIISRKSVADFDACQKFAVSKKALAFNYREPSESAHRHRASVCQALECPVIYDSAELINDTGYNYYSLYPTQKPSENSSLQCVPSVGIFYISEEHLSYKKARESCRKMGGTLAHIASEERTEGLGRVIPKVPTFVGLSNRDRERLWKNEFALWQQVDTEVRPDELDMRHEPLSCFDYRGWAESEPAHTRGCVVLVSSEKRFSSSTWRVTPCSRKLPYVCEIMTDLQSRENSREENSRTGSIR